MGIGQFGRSLHLLVSGVQFAIADILPHCAGEQVGVLEHNAQRAPEVRLFYLVDIDTVIAYLAIRNVVEAVE